MSYSSLERYDVCNLQYMLAAGGMPRTGHPMARAGDDFHERMKARYDGQEPPPDKAPLSAWSRLAEFKDMADRMELDREGLLGTERIINWTWDFEGPEGCPITTVHFQVKIDRQHVYEGGRCKLVDYKGLALTTLLPTPEGWTTMADVCVGDRVLDVDGQPCRVTAKSAVKRIGTFTVRFDNGAEVVCDTEHLWWTRFGNEVSPSVKPITQVAANLRHRGQLSHRLPVCGPLVLPDVELPIDPYVLGCWLGDGEVRGGGISKTADLFEVLAVAHPLGVEQVDGRSGVITRTVVGLKLLLRQSGLLHNKHIPPPYLRAAFAQRLALLQGLMDTDGSWNRQRRRAVFSNTDGCLARQVYDLLVTLGQRPHLAEVEGVGFGKTVTSYQVEFAPVNLNPFQLPRKRDLVEAGPCQARAGSPSRRHLIVSVEPGPDVPTACIEVDSPTHMYLCGRDMIPTHNTGQVVPKRVDDDPQGLTYALGTYIEDPSLWEWTFEQPQIAYGVIPPPAIFTLDKVLAFERVLKAKIQELILRTEWKPNPGDGCWLCPYSLNGCTAGGKLVTDFGPLIDEESAKEYVKLWVMLDTQKGKVAGALKGWMLQNPGPIEIASGSYRISQVESFSVPPDKVPEAVELIAEFTGQPLGDVAEEHLSLKDVTDYVRQIPELQAMATRKAYGRPGFVKATKRPMKTHSFVKETLGP
jgi:hypothetical protein